MTLSDTNTQINGQTGNVTTIDGGLITTGTLDANRINLNSNVGIGDPGGAISSGISDFPASLANIQGTGFWLGLDDDGLPKFFVGRGR